MTTGADGRYERTLGGMLRIARQQAGLSQSEVEATSGIPKARLSRYENNHVVPSLGSFVRICAAIQIKPGSILDGPDPPSLR